VERINLNSDAEVIYCPACQKYKRIKSGVYKIKLAVNDESKNCQYKASLYSYYMVICKDCKKKIFDKPKKVRKHSSFCQKV